MTKALRIGGIAAAVGLLAIVIVRLGPTEIAAQLLAAGPGFLWILLIHAVAIAVAAVPWYVLLPRPARPTFSQAIASRFVSTGANAVLPLFGFAGDLVRLWWLRRGDRAAGVAALVVDRLVYGAANAALLLGGLLALVHVASLPPEYTRAATIGVVGLLAVVVLGVVLASRFRIAGRIHRLIHRMRRRVEEDSQFGDDVDHHIEQMLHRRASAPWLGWLLHLASKLAIGAEVYVGFALLGVWLDWDQALVFAALPVMLSFSGVVVPSQVGVQEGAHALLAASFGLSPTTAVAVALLLRVRQLVSAALVLGLLALRHRAPRTPGSTGPASGNALP